MWNFDYLFGFRRKWSQKVYHIEVFFPLDEEISGQTIETYVFDGKFIEFNEVKEALWDTLISIYVIDWNLWITVYLQQYFYVIDNNYISHHRWNYGGNTKHTLYYTCSFNASYKLSLMASTPEITAALKYDGISSIIPELSAVRDIIAPKTFS